MNKSKPASAKVQITKDGPYLVSGALPLSRQTIGTNSGGESVEWKAGHRVSRAGELCIVPLRSQREEAVLRWFA